MVYIFKLWKHDSWNISVLKMDFKMDLTYNEGLWGRNAIYKRKENTQEMYSGTEITTINRR